MRVCLAEAIARLAAAEAQPPRADERANETK
jgi:hypothetical protein